MYLRAVDVEAVDLLHRKQHGGGGVRRCTGGMKDSDMGAFSVEFELQRCSTGAGGGTTVVDAMNCGPVSRAREAGGIRHSYG
jgi:hypothetical protein